MPQTPRLTIVGSLTDIHGDALVNGQLKVQLCNYGSSVPRVLGASVIAGIALSIDCPDGSFSFAIWGNDVIVPEGTFYTVQILDASRNILQTASYQFMGSGVQNLSDLTPYNPSPAAVAPNVILANPPGGATQTIAGSLVVTGSLSTGLLNPAQPYVIVPFSATPGFDCANGSIFDLLLSGNVSASTLSGAAIGQQVTFVIAQDATGGRSFAWPANVHNAGEIDPTPNAVNVQTFLVRADHNLYPISVMTVN